MSLIGKKVTFVLSTGWQQANLVGAGKVVAVHASESGWLVLITDESGWLHSCSSHQVRIGELQ